MNRRKEMLGTIGLIAITFMSAAQYFFLELMPADVPTFAFLFSSDALGLIVLLIARPRKMLHLQRNTLLKGMLLAAELTGYNVFLVMGSVSMSSVLVSSVISLYFVFITPILILLRRRTSFLSLIATMVGAFALLLMFSEDMQYLQLSDGLIFLIISNLFFAAYLVTVSIVVEGEDSVQLTQIQLLFVTIFALIGWFVECRITRTQFSFPSANGFLLCTLFYGICIRAVYSIVQISAQRYVSPLKTSLIISSEVLITLFISVVLNISMEDMGTPSVSGIQIVGAILLVIATHLSDEAVMARFGYEDLLASSLTRGRDKDKKNTVSRKIVLTTLGFAMLTLLSAIFLFTSSIFIIRDSAMGTIRSLGDSAAGISTDMMRERLEDSMQKQVADKAMVADAKLDNYSDTISYVTEFAQELYRHPERYPKREVAPANTKNAGVWVMQRTMANPDLVYDDTLRAQCELLGNMEDVFVPSISENVFIATIYMGTKEGLLISYDPSSDSAVTEMNGTYEFRDSYWYQQGMRQTGPTFTETTQDVYGRGLVITCVAPFFDKNGEFAGCVAMDVLMTDINKAVVNDGIEAPSAAVLIDRQGNFIAGKDVDENAEDPGTIFDSGRNDALRLAGDELLSGKKQGLLHVGEGAGAEYIAYSTIEGTPWILCLMSPVSTVLEPANRIADNIEQNTAEVVSSVREGITRVIQGGLVLCAIILIFVTLFAGRISKRISDPLKELESEVRQIRGGSLDRRVSVTTNDEIGSLAVSFNEMTDSLQQYISDLKTATAREERIAGELSIATRIQEGMLPTNFDEFSAGYPFRIWASMEPAKEVGGDFYDFFLVDETHIGLTIADVSGKGIPASLFMMASMITLRSLAMSSDSPAEIMTRMNDMLMADNKAEMFVTVWLGILDLTTGTMKAVNAGHEYPVIRHPDGRFELLKDRHGMVVGGMPGISYREYELQLEPGSRLFVYTDGVPEATNAEEKMFGTERMVDALNADPDAAPAKVLKNMKRAVVDFVRSAPQFDDMTMMIFDYQGNMDPPLQD